MSTPYRITVNETGSLASSELEERIVEAARKWPGADGQALLDELVTLVLRFEPSLVVRRPPGAPEPPELEGDPRG